MIVGKVLWVLALFVPTTFAYNLTCTDLSWESNVKRAALTLRNAGNHILVLSSMRLDCYGDDKRFEYTNKSVLLNPGQNMDLPSDPWMNFCSATFCSACLIYQCNIITQLNPNATLTFLYNVSDYSGVRYAHQPHVRAKKYSDQFVSSTPVCPKDMVSVWTKEELPTALIDIPNKKKKKTLYTVTLTCNGSYLLDEYGNATESFTHTTSVRKSRADVIVTVPLQEPGETQRTCTLNACLHRKRYCKQKVLCTFTIPDNSVALTNFNKWKKTRYRTVGCSQTKWVWSAIDQQTGDLHIRLQNKDWKEKSFIVSVRCKRLTALNNSLLVTVPPMVYTEFISFPLKISAVKSSATSTKCVIKLCNTAKKKCGRNTKCSIKLPLNNGKFITTLFNITDDNITDQCGSKAVTWSRQAKRRGTLSVRLQNAKQETITATASVNCSGLEVPEQLNVTVELPPNTQGYVVKFKLKPTSIDSTAVEIYCTVNICNAKGCEYLGESCNTTIPVKDGSFAKIEDGDTNTGLLTNEAIWTQQGTNQGTLSVELRNTKQKNINAEITVNCFGLEIVNEEWNKTVKVFSNSQNTAEFRLRPSSTLDYAAVETSCTIVISDTKDGDNKRVSQVTIPVQTGSFPDDNSTNNIDRFYADSVVWSRTAAKRGIVSVQLHNSKNITVITEVTVNCAGLKVLKDQWNLTTEVLKNSQHVVEFKIKPISTIDLTAVETHCIVNICNREDCENQRESHNVTIPIRKGIFSNEEDGSCDPYSVTWEIRDPQRVIMSVELQNFKQENISVQVSVVCSEIKVQKNAWNITAVVPGDSLYSEKFKLKPQSTIDITAVEAHCTIKTCNIEDCWNHERLCSYDITIPVENGSFPVIGEDKNTSNGLPENDEDENTYMSDGLFSENREDENTYTNDELFPDYENTYTSDELFSENEEDNNRIHERETITLCPSDIIFSNQSSSDFPTVFVIVRNFKKNALPFIIEIICNNILVFQDNGTLSESVMKRIPSIQPKAQKVVEFRFQNNSNREKTCALDICVELKTKCSSEMSCEFTFLKNTTLATNHDHRECTQTDAVWEVNQPPRGVMKVKAYNVEQEEIEATVTLHCSSFLQPVNDRITDLITIPGGSFRPVKFRFLLPADTMHLIDAEEAQCVINICPRHNCTIGVKETCIIRMPIEDGGFVIVKSTKKKDNETKYISHKCHNKHLNTDMHSLAPCHNRMWNLVYTSTQLVGEALLIITLNIKPSNQIDLRTNVSLKCEGIIIEDDAQKILMISKYENQRNVSFAITTIRSLHLERHICTLSVQHSLLVASTNNITDDAIRKLCLKGEKCSIAIDSRLGRIIPKCNLTQVKSPINYTSVDQNSAKVIISILPSIYDVFTYEAHCSKNNPFAYDPIHEKKTNAFVSESKETKVIAVEYAPDCNNDTIRKEYENYRKDDCNFLLYGYCQGGELLLEKLVNIQFDHDNMYCTPKLLFNKWLQTIQKHTGIHNKPLAAILAVFIVIVILLIVILPIVIVVYCCCCRRHRDDAKKRPMGIVVSSCDEWEETTAVLNAISAENSKFLAGRSDQQIPDPITCDFDSTYDSFDSLSSDHEDVGDSIHQLNSDKAGQDDHVDQENSAIYHDHEDHHHHYRHIDQHDAYACDSTALHTAQLELEAAIKQLDVINDSIPEEQYSNLSVTRTDFSSSLHGWGDEDGDTVELLKPNY